MTCLYLDYKECANEEKTVNKDSSIRQQRINAFIKKLLPYDLWPCCQNLQVQDMGPLLRAALE